MQNFKLKFNLCIWRNKKDKLYYREANEADDIV